MSTKPCEYCHGAGQLSAFMGVSRFLLSWEDCPHCGGTGRVPADDPTTKKLELVMEKPRPNPERVAFLRALPQEIKEKITGEEARAFMYDEPLPETLLDKLRDYLVDDQA